MISIQRFQPILKDQISLNRLADELPDLFVGANPYDLVPLGQDLYEKRQHRKEDQETPQSTFRSSTPNPQLCQQNGCCPSCR
jgi:hypothetical protein